MTNPPSPRVNDYLNHMIVAAETAISYTDGLTQKLFHDDPKTQQAVIFNMMVLGEAASKIAAECASLADSHPEVPWRQMRGMRNRMAHGYFEIDLDIVWDTVQNSLPALILQLRKIHAGID